MRKQLSSGHSTYQASSPQQASYEMGYHRRSILLAKPLPWEVEEDNECLKNRVSNRSTKLGSDSLQKSSLAKLAAAFSPPEYAINLEHIEHVEVVNVAGDKIEIQATICDGQSEGCVAMFVPVSFPNSCLHLFYDEEEEMCILNNLSLLHHDAEGKITRQLSTRENDSLESLRPDLQLDQSRPSNIREFCPSWWVAAEDAFGPQLIPSLKTTDLVNECSTIKSLLNDGDFDDELRALAQDGMSGVKNGLSLEVERAVIADVSPTGFFIRARAVDVSDRRSIVELFWPFDGEPAKDPTALRSKVLGAIAAISSGVI